MAVFLVFLLTGIFATALTVPARGADAPKPLEVVPTVDLQRYQGMWYEVARLPNRFQRDCAGNTTATYTLRGDGKIAVLNQCRDANGKTKSANGTAKLASKTGPPSKLRVTFFWPFYGDYWIIDLDPNYQWAVVGEPDRKYFWILSRTPLIDKATFDAILVRAKAQGYDVSALIIAKT